MQVYEPDVHFKINSTCNKDEDSIVSFAIEHDRTKVEVACVRRIQGNTMFIPLYCWFLVEEVEKHQLIIIVALTW